MGVLFVLEALANLSKMIKLKVPHHGGLADCNKQISRLLGFSRQIRENAEIGDIQLDFGDLDFICPFFGGGLFALTQHSINARGKTISYHLPNSRVGNYLRHVQFGGGMKPESVRDWKRAMAGYTGKTYIPFLDFPATKRPSEIEARNKFLSQVNTLIER
jgi:hypothetical protein